MEVIINSIQNNPNFAEEEDEEAKKEQVYLWLMKLPKLLN
jgi:hypothetical protein